jgi:hypothetical protein
MNIKEEFAKPTIDAAFRHMVSKSEVAISLINSLIP